MKNILAFSTLTETIYWVDGRGAKRDVTSSFMNVVFMWLTHVKEIPRDAKMRTITKVFTTDTDVYEITVIRKSKSGEAATPEKQ